MVQMTLILVMCVRELQFVIRTLSGGLDVSSLRYSRPGRNESCRGSRVLSGQHLMAPRIWRLRASSPRNRSLRSSVGGAARFSGPLLIYSRESCLPTAPTHWLSFTALQYQGHSRGACIHGTYDCVTYDLCAHLLWVLGPVPDGRC